MLKKTNFSRGSMKRNKSENQESSQASNFNFQDKKSTSGPSVVYQSNRQGQVSTNNVRPSHKYPAPSPTNKHQIAPGLVIEGEEVDL